MHPVPRLRPPRQPSNHIHLRPPLCHLRIIAWNRRLFSRYATVLGETAKAPTTTRSTLSLDRKRPCDPDGLCLHVILALCLCAALLSPEEGQDADDDEDDGCEGRRDGYAAFRAGGEDVVGGWCNERCGSGWTTWGGR